jgi:hypothetical protein
MEIAVWAGILRSVTFEFPPDDVIERQLAERALGLGRDPGTLELMAIMSDGSYLSTVIQADGTLIEHGFGGLGRLRK